MANVRADQGFRYAERELIRDIQPADLVDALKAGLDDFLEKPSHVVFLVLIYPLVGLTLARLTFGYDVLPLLYPLMAGFALLGPFASVGLYELSRRREQGLSTRWADVFTTLRQKPARPVLQLGGLLVLVFLGWLVSAQWIYQLTFGSAIPDSLLAFLGEVATTSHGWALLIVGNAVGFMFAVVVLAISVVSFPMVLDREVSAGTALRTSIHACLANPSTMALWGLIVAVCLAIGSLPFFAGLALVLPVFGHATWHLYRKVIAR
jgi:uncharacterized membrane protein